MDMDLEARLKSLEPGLSDCLADIKKSCLEIWKERLLHWFTNHNCDHSSEIVHILGQILKPIERHETFLTNHELFILLSGCA